MDKTIKIGEKDVSVKEFKYIQALELQELTKGALGKKMMELATTLTIEEINELSLKDGIALQKIINEINGLDMNLDFQKPIVEEAK